MYAVNSILKELDEMIKLVPYGWQLEFIRFCLPVTPETGFPRNYPQFA